ncbi:MAG: histidine kinase [Muribaculaceae bacterium]|nr:histidine kinase [Muribaculaceae bacterium]
MKQREFLIHLLCWGIIICFPLFFFGQGDGHQFALPRFLRTLGGPLSYMIVFYVNYLWLVPDFLLSNDRNKVQRFIFVNMLLVLVAVAINSVWWQTFTQLFDLMNNKRPPMNHSRIPMYFHASLMEVLIVSLSVALRIGQRWQNMERRRKEAEQAKTEAELLNLRNQLNPHFLLNTLNNIYSLIAIDGDKAQKVVEELSRLLRHMLYEDQEGTVPLHKEAEFVSDYIDLMRIRCSNNVTVTTNINVDEDDCTPIAPVLFISLVENAFKHGVSPTEASFISVSLYNDNGTVVCDIENSNFPKSQADKSGSGIGLEQVGRRLSLLYPGKHTWDRGVSADGKTYRSTIRIEI